MKTSPVDCLIRRTDKALSVLLRDWKPAWHRVVDHRHNWTWGRRNIVWAPWSLCLREHRCVIKEKKTRRTQNITTEFSWNELIRPLQHHFFRDKEHGTFTYHCWVKQCAHDIENCIKTLYIIILGYNNRRTWTITAILFSKERAEQDALPQYSCTEKHWN